MRELGERFADRDDVLATTSAALTSADLVDARAGADRGRDRVAPAKAWRGSPTRAVADAVGGSARALNDDQARAVRAVAGSGNGVDVIEALAGTGKTYTAGVLRERLRACRLRRDWRRAVRASRAGAHRAGRHPDRGHSTAASCRSPTATRCRSGASSFSTRPGWRRRGRANGCSRTPPNGGAKVIAIGDPGQLPSVQAGGWLRALGRRLGAVQLTEVMRQRDPTERPALAALHDGNPERWIDWAIDQGRIEVFPDDRGVLDQAVAEWAAGVEAHGIEQSVLIARGNDTRRALNELARDQRRDGRGARRGPHVRTGHRRGRRSRDLPQQRA